jgi:hypothetical protein
VYCQLDCRNGKTYLNILICHYNPTKIAGMGKVVCVMPNPVMKSQVENKCRCLPDKMRFLTVVVDDLFKFMNQSNFFVVDEYQDLLLKMKMAQNSERLLISST